MELNGLNQLEEKVKKLVDNLKILRDENQKLKAELTQLKEESSVSSKERLEIKKKVETLIGIIDSIE
jgi:FtsZ-binding cell division protein ZapB